MLKGTLTNYRDADPAKDSTDLTVRKKIHTTYLANAVEEKDSLKIVLGNLYLSDDYLKANDYSLAIEVLINADKVAIAKKDTLLLGRINHRKGCVYSFIENFPEAIKYFKLALQQSEAAKDSQFIAITLEQLGQVYVWIEDFETSNGYYQQAIGNKKCGIKRYVPPN